MQNMERRLLPHELVNTVSISVRIFHRADSEIPSSLSDNHNS